MSKKDSYAVMGFPISHSKSPYIHTLFAKQTGQELVYTREEVKPENFETAVNNFLKKGGQGLNCTVPLKELAFNFVDYRTERASFAKAVNTLALQIDGTILGDNTDGIGLVIDLTVNHQIDLTHKRLLILGAGGATRGIIAPLADYNLAEIVIANRTIDKATHLATEFQKLDTNIHGCGFEDLENRQFDLIINATSASLSNELPPLPKGILAEGGICYDLAYSNTPTVFVKWGNKNHALKSLDGLGMLVEQAAESFYLWRRIRPETQNIINLLHSER